MNRKSSLMDFCIFLTALFCSDLDVLVKQCAELSTDLHLVVCDLRLNTNEHAELRDSVLDQGGDSGGQKS